MFKPKTNQPPHSIVAIFRNNAFKGYVCTFDDDTRVIGKLTYQRSLALPVNDRQIRQIRRELEGYYDVYATRLLTPPEDQLITSSTQVQANQKTKTSSEQFCLVA